MEINENFHSIPETCFAGSKISIFEASCCLNSSYGFDFNIENWESFVPSSFPHPETVCQWIQNISTDRRTFWLPVSGQQILDKTFINLITNTPISEQLVRQSTHLQKSFLEQLQNRYQQETKTHLHHKSQYFHPNNLSQIHFSNTSNQIPTQQIQQIQQSTLSQTIPPPVFLNSSSQSVIQPIPKFRHSPPETKQPEVISPSKIPEGILEPDEAISEFSIRIRELMEKLNSDPYEMEKWRSGIAALMYIFREHTYITRSRKGCKQPQILNENGKLCYQCPCCYKKFFEKRPGDPREDHYQTPLSSCKKHLGSAHYPLLCIACKWPDELYEKGNGFFLKNKCGNSQPTEKMVFHVGPDISLSRKKSQSDPCFASVSTFVEHILLIHFHRKQADSISSKYKRAKQYPPNDDVERKKKVKVS